MWRWCRRNPAVACLSATVVVLMAGLALLAASRASGPTGSRHLRLPRLSAPEVQPVSSTDDLLQSVSDLDRTDPGWRLEDMDKSRKKVPPERDGAAQVCTITPVLLSQHWPAPEASTRMMAIWNQPLPLRLGVKDVGFLRGELAKVSEPLARARRIYKFPEGRFRIVWSRNAMETLLPEHQDTRNVVNLLQWNVLVQIHDGNIDGR